jgi:glycosyltransferase XagB
VVLRRDRDEQDLDSAAFPAAEHQECGIGLAGSGTTGRLEQCLSRLETLDPAYTARTGVWRNQQIALAAIMAVVAGAVWASDVNVTLAIEALMALICAGLLSVRLLALYHTGGPDAQHGTSGCTLPGGELPVYTVLVALHDEVAVAGKLVTALRAFDYPGSRLDIIFILEADDAPTHCALSEAGLADHMRVVTVPAGTPRTKPRALSYGLTFARGNYVVVYDAEDRPEPDQLLRAVAMFRSSGSKLGCLQAGLNIYNPRQSLATAWFTVEYTTLFDAILPALARHRLPVPLGGTSNHFPRLVLETSGGWDPYNVTEDADLGFRLARQGWYVGILPSTTWEEAPPKWREWTNQRTRWHKGWMQTYIVHMRDPARLWRELGPARFAWFQIVLGGTLLSSLAHPWYLAHLIWQWANGTLWPGPEQTDLTAAIRWIGLLTLAGAALATILLGLIALSRRNRPDLYWAALVSPLYWLPVSYSAHRAVIEYIRAPFHWSKTPHGTQAPPR